MSQQAIVWCGLHDSHAKLSPIGPGFSKLQSSRDGRGAEVGLRDGGGAGAHHEEGVPDPEAPPGPRTRGDGLVLAVHRHSLGGGLAHGAAADVRADLVLRERLHGQRRGARQPVGPVVPPGIVAHLVDVAVGEGQRAKDGEAGARQTWAGETTWRLSALLGDDLPYPAPSADTHLALGGGWGRGHRVGVRGPGQSLLLWAPDHFGHLSGLTGLAAFFPGSHIALLS